MSFEYILFLMLCILPVFYKLTFWLYTIQLKEYRLDRFTEYIGTPQGKKALFNFWFFIELPLFIGSFSIFLDKNFEIIIFPIVFYFLGIYNIFVLGKILRRRLLLPKTTGRLGLIALVLVTGIIGGFYCMLSQGHGVLMYTYILGLLIFFPLAIFFSIFLTSPLTHYKKQKLISRAILKSQKIDDVIKIGITGSYGKSSVKEFLSSILEQDISPHSVSPNGREVAQNVLIKTPENINTELGVSDIILRKLNNSYKYFVAEMGAYKIGEISTLGEIVNHKHGFLTAIGNQHLALFGGIENTKKAKCEIAESVLKNNGTLYINWNNENIQDAFNETKKNSPIIPFIKGDENKLIKYGNTQGSDAVYSNIKIINSSTQFNFTYKQTQATFEIPLIGEHHVLNITGVIACCIDLGLQTSEIKKYLKNLLIPKNTLEITHLDSLTLIDDTYNLSEAGLLAGIDVMTHFHGEKILVIDDILELGKTAGTIHYNLGKKLVSEKLVDKVLFCGVNYKKDFEKGLIEGGFEVENILKNLGDVGEGSVVLFEGRKARGYLEKIKK